MVKNDKCIARASIENIKEVSVLKMLKNRTD